MSIALSRPNWFRRRSALPGFTLSLGFSVIYLSLIVVIPLAGLALYSTRIGWEGFLSIAADPRVLKALQLSFGTAMLAALINAVFGVIVAWALVRYRFPGRGLLDAAVDLPLALPTAVAGIALAALYAPNGPLGDVLQEHVGVQVAFRPFGIVLALVFVGVPFVVRTVEPVLRDMERETEEAAVTLGASRMRTVFQVVLPNLVPAILTGFALAFARGLGEYGSVIFIAGNIPYVSEIAPLLVVIRLEENNYAAATAIAVIMLGVSFLSLLLINLLQAWSRRRFGHA